MNEQHISNILDRAFGIPIHKPIAESIEIDGDWSTAKCAKCNAVLTSIWRDDEDRLTGWSAWRGDKKCIPDEVK